MTTNDLPNLADGLNAAANIAHVAEVLHGALGAAGHTANLGLPSSFGLEWNDTPETHQLALVSAAGEVLSCVVSHLQPPEATPLTREQAARVACLGAAAQVLPPARGAFGTVSAPRYLDLLIVAQWLVEGGDPLKNEPEGDEDETDEVDEPETPEETTGGDVVDLHEHDTEREPS